MKVIINISNRLIGGGLQVALSFLHECRFQKNIKFWVFVNESILDQIDLCSFGCNFEFITIPKLHICTYHFYLSKIEAKINPNIVFTVFGPAYWRPKSKHIVGFARGHFLYEDFYFIQKYGFKDKIVFKILKIIFTYLFNRESDALIVETEDANQRLAKLLPTKKIFTVSNTFSTHFTNSIFKSILSPKKDNEIRFLTISSYYPHKNLQIISSVISELKKRGIFNVKFVLTIKDEDFEKYFLDKKEGIINLGPIENKLCPSLYNECDFIFLPTLLEIFSASYPEAMIMHKPILTSDLSFARSICGDAALYFDPLNLYDIVEKIILIINDSALQNTLKEKGKIQLKNFPNAQERACQYLKLIRQLC